MAAVAASKERTRMAKTRRIGITVTLIAIMLAAIPASIAAQTPKPIGLVTFVDGAVGPEGADLPMDIYVDGELEVEDIDFGDTSTVVQLASGSHDVEYREAGTSTVVGGGSLSIANGSSQSFASFWNPNASEPFQAVNYPDTVEPITDGNGVLVLRNISDRDPLEVTINGDPKADLDAFGGNQIAETLPAGTYDVVFSDPSNGISDIPVQVDLEADSYVNVFAAGAADNQSGAVQVIIDSMTDLIEFLTEQDPTTVPVPNVTGQTAAEARDTLEAEGFSVTESEEANTDVPAGEVIRTEPAAGTEVEEGSTVEIVVSTGAETVAVPDVVGKTAADAEVEIQDAGLRISTSQEPSDDVDQGLVIRTDPEAGTEVELGTTVAVVVSAGAEPIVVPDVTGRTEADARAELEDLGLVVEVRTESSEDVDEGLVISTDPAAGVTVEAGTTVTMTVSSGPEPQPDEASIALAMSSSGVLTVSGVNFLPDSIVESLIVGTDISSTERVDADGLWQTELDMSSLVSGATYQLLVTGTDAQGNRFEDLQLIPTFGGEDDDSISPWVWVIGLALLAGVIALLLWLVSRNQDAEEPGGGGGTGTITAASGTAVAADDAGADTIVMDELPDEDPGDPGAGG